MVHGQHAHYSFNHIAADDCAARAFCGDEHSKEVDDDNEKEQERMVDKTNDESDSIDKTKESKGKAKSKDVSEGKKSEYEVQREKNIEENRTLLATIKGSEFEAAMGELKKGPAVPRKKNKGKMSKPDGEERRISAHLSNMDRT